MQNLFCTSWPLDASSSSVCLVLMYCDPPIATKPAIRADQAVFAASKTTVKDTKNNRNSAIFSTPSRKRYAQGKLVPRAICSLRQATSLQGVQEVDDAAGEGGSDVFLGWKFTPR